MANFDEMAHFLTLLEAHGARRAKGARTISDARGSNDARGTCTPENWEWNFHFRFRS